MGIFALVIALITALVASVVFFYNRAAKEARGGSNDLTMTWSNKVVTWPYLHAFYILKIQVARRVLSSYVNRMMIKCGLTPKTCCVRIAQRLHNASLDRGEVTYAEIIMAILYGFDDLIWVERVIRRGDVVQLWSGTYCAFDGKRVAWAEWRQELGCDDNNWGWEFGFLSVANWPYGNAEGVKCTDFSTEDSKAAGVFKTLPAAQKLGITRR